MLKIRLKRIGKKNSPAFRVVLLDSKKGAQTGKVNEILGSYNPHINVKSIKADRVKYWISNGAQVSDTVHNILVSEKIIEGRKINVLPRKSPVAKELAEGIPLSETPASVSDTAGENEKDEQASVQDENLAAPIDIEENASPEEPHQEVNEKALGEEITSVGIPAETKGGGEPNKEKGKKPE